MSIPRQVEQSILVLCDAIWNENMPNHMCGLLEEAIELVHASGSLTQEQLSSIVQAIIKRVYSQPVPDKEHRDEALHNELMDITIMACILRQYTSHLDDLTLLSASGTKIFNLYQKWETDPAYFTNKIQKKIDTGIRFPQKVKSNE